MWTRKKEGKDESAIFCLLKRRPTFHLRHLSAMFQVSNQSTALYLIFPNIKFLKFFNKTRYLKKIFIFISKLFPHRLKNFNSSYFF